MWNFLGYQKGERAPDFTLYTEDGKPCNLYSELRKGKPVVLFNGSYTCDVSRGHLPAIDSIIRKFCGKINFFMIYTIEAHPSDAPSPYSQDKAVWIAKNNIRDGISAPQPKTYGERAKLSKRWKEESHISCPVLVDTPNNAYWLNFGEAPSMAYVIAPDGIVYYKQAWFNKAELNKNILRLLAQT